MKTAMMDEALCDEMLQEIFQRLPPSSSPAISLVSHRWLTLHRSSLTSLTLRIPKHSQLLPSFLVLLLHRYTYLLSLTVLLPVTYCFEDEDDLGYNSDNLLLCLIAYPPRRHRLRHLRFMLGSVSSAALQKVSMVPPFRNLVSLNLSRVRPLCFRWVQFFPCLRELFVLNCSPSTGSCLVPEERAIRRGLLEEGEVEEEEELGEQLGLEVLSLCGIRRGDHGFRWLWRRCGNLRCLQLRSCEGTGDGSEGDGEYRLLRNYKFAGELRNLQRLELRSCRTIADRVLLEVAENCRSLNSLLLYDGGSREGLRRFIQRCTTSLHTLDFRLPLDLDNTHLITTAETFRNLTTLRLHSCCLVTGDGLRSIGQVTGGSLSELTLVNCDVIEKEIGLLTFLGQTLRLLRRLDLSHNDMLVDRELGSMLVSCKNLIEINLRGCRRLTNAIITKLIKCCEGLETVDVTNCCGINIQGVETLIEDSPRLKKIVVDDSNLSPTARSSASRRSIQVC